AASAAVVASAVNGARQELLTIDPPCGPARGARPSARRRGPRLHWRANVARRPRILAPEMRARLGSVRVPTQCRATAHHCHRLTPRITHLRGGVPRNPSLQHVGSRRQGTDGVFEGVSMGARLCAALAAGSAMLACAPAAHAASTLTVGPK